MTLAHLTHSLWDFFRALFFFRFISIIWRPIFSSYFRKDTTKRKTRKTNKHITHKKKKQKRLHQKTNNQNFMWPPPGPGYGPPPGGVPPAGGYPGLFGEFFDCPIIISFIFFFFFFISPNLSHRRSSSSGRC